MSFCNAFAAANSYATYLKNTGAALSDYAHDEVTHFPISSFVTQPIYSLPWTKLLPMGFLCFARNSGPG